VSIVCEHSIGNDPRHPTTCLKCGREVSGRWLRDLGRERQLIVRASKDQVHSENLVRFAQSRSGLDSVRMLRSRSFHTEVREELADAANYLCWLDDQRHIRGEDGLTAGELACLHHLTEAWRWLHVGSED